MICRPILKNVKNWILDRVGGQHKTAYEIPVTQVFNSRIRVFILNKIAMLLKKKAKAVCFGIIGLNRFLSFFRLEFVLLKRERRCSHILPKRATSHETYFILDRSLMAFRINILSCLLSIAQLPALIFI